MTVLAGELAIHRAAELKQQLLEALAGPGPIELDLSQVTELDTAGLQLLLAAAREARAAKRDLRLVGHSAAVLEVFDLLLLAPDLAR